MPATKKGFLLCSYHAPSLIAKHLGTNKCTPAGSFHNGKNLLEKSRYQKPKDGPADIAVHDKYWRLVRDEERRESDPQGLLIEIRETEAKLQLEAAKLKRTETP